MKKFSKNKKTKFILIITLLIIALLSGIIYIKDNNYIFLYINPDNNTKIYPYIAKSSNKINDILFSAVKQLKTYSPDAKILYTNGYGSGFIKNNETSNDLAYGAGVYLGKFNYTGKNSIQVAQNLIKSIVFYQSAIYSFAEQPDLQFYVQKPTSKQHSEIYNAQNINTLSTSIKSAVNGKMYKMNIDSKIFLLRPSEVIIPDTQLIKLYNKKLSYGKNYREMLRKITISTDYYFDLTYGEKTFPITILTNDENEMNFDRHGLKYFVPNVYTSLASFNYVRNIMHNLDDKKYFHTRLVNYFHHFTLMAYGNSQTCGNPISVVKQLLQCTDILAPILPKKVLTQIHKNVYEILDNSTMSLLNDYYTANEVLYEITKSSSFYKELEQNKEVSNHINTMEHILSDMINDPHFAYKDLKPLFDYQKKLSDAKNNVTAMQKLLNEEYTKSAGYLDRLIFAKMPNNRKINVYMTYLNKVLESGGFYNIKFYNDRENHVYVMLDDYTKNIDLNQLNKLTPENGFYAGIFDKNTEFEYMAASDFYGDTRKLTYSWTRHNSSALQNSVYKDMEKYMIKDKHRYHLRIRPGITR